LDLSDAVRSSFANTLHALVRQQQPQRKEELLSCIMECWRSDVCGESILSASRFIYDLATRENSPLSCVEQYLPYFIEGVRCGDTPRRIASMMLLHRLCMCNSETRTASIRLGCIEPIFKALQQGGEEEKEIASYALVTFSCGEEGTQ
jgi:hypothetical protein